jgi:hypothetical protein
MMPGAGPSWETRDSESILELQIMELQKGQLCRIIGIEASKIGHRYNGHVVEIAGERRQCTCLNCLMVWGGPVPWYQVHGLPGGLQGCAERNLVPLSYDGNQVVPWEAMPWRPSTHERPGT